jgi:energy-coupling factor transporter ATP-binding protein EcfA2
MKRDRIRLPDYIQNPIDILRSFVENVSSSTALEGRWACVRGPHGSGKTTLCEALANEVTSQWKVEIIRQPSELVRLEQLSSSLDSFFSASVGGGGGGSTGSIAIHEKRSTLVLLDLGNPGRLSPVLRRRLKELHRRLLRTKPVREIAVVLFELHATEARYSSISRMREIIGGKGSVHKRCNTVICMKAPPGHAYASTVESSALPLLTRALRCPTDASKNMEDMLREREKVPCAVQLRQLLHENYLTRTTSLGDAVASAELLSLCDLHIDRREWTPLLAGVIYHTDKESHTASTFRMKAPRSTPSFVASPALPINKYMHQ